MEETFSKDFLCCAQSKRSERWARGSSLKSCRLAAKHLCENAKWEKNFSSARQLTSDCCCAGRRPGCQWKTAVHAQQAFPRQITTLQEKFPGRVCQCLSRKKKKNTTSPFRLLNWPSLSVWIRDHNEMLTIIVSSTPSSPTQLQWATMWMTVALQTRGRVQRRRLSKYRFRLFYVTERWQRWDWFTCEPPTRVWISDICKMMQQI